MPQRTCVGCRLTLPKRSLIRVVRRPDGVHLDPSGKLAGRGAYLHDTRSCWERGLKGALANALKTELSVEDRGRLNSYLNSLPPENPQTEHLDTISPENAPVEASQTEAGNVM